jgi:WD40 repeat protein
MSKELIRHLATSLSGSWVAAAEFEHAVHIWSMETGKLVRTLATPLDFGGRRLGVSADGKSCVVGAFTIGNVISYDTDAGVELWRRQGLAHPQRVGFTPDDRQIIVSLDKLGCHMLERSTGKTLDVFKGIRAITRSPYGPLSLFCGKSLEIRNASGTTEAMLPRKSFAELAVAFGPQHLCVSESAGPLRCWDLRDYSERWCHHEADRHALYLACNPSSEAFYAVDWAYKHGGKARLLRFESSTGQLTVVREFERLHLSAFCLEGTRLINACGEMIDVETGQIIGQLWQS